MTDATSLAAVFQEVFADLDPTRPFPVERLYDPDVRFEDPFHRIEGRDALGRYFDRLTRNVERCTFDFHTVLVGERDVMMTWTMHLTPRGRFASPMDLSGASHLQLGVRCSAHRDYFDAGELVYERIPLLGTLIRGIKRQVG
jgi:hypothetical protein